MKICVILAYLNIIFFGFLLGAGDIYAYNEIYNDSSQGREIISLNGVWSCEPGAKNSMPSSWNYTLRVPGLVDLIKPKIEWNKSKYFWYKKTFIVSSAIKNPFAFIKIEQSKYGTDVWLNGVHVGSYIGCYTSSEYDVSKVIKFDKPNELIVRVGSRDNLDKSSAAGYDFEKASYIPGIWGDVSLILTGSVKITAVRVIPDIHKKIAKAKIHIHNLTQKNQEIYLFAMLVEKKTNVISSEVYKKKIKLKAGEKKIASFDIEIPDMKLWSPQSPFLYKLITKIKNSRGEQDYVKTTFGMREFKIVGPDFYFNGRKCYLRGSNIAFHRFLSDPKRSGLVWDKEWIKKALIDIPKRHNFNFFRNHLGQMYNRWYDIADEYGMFLQNEWAFWEITGDKEQIKKEFRQWVMDNFNHPSIILWDPVNEQTGSNPKLKVIINEVIPELKKLDPTRSWEYVDFLEDHPYIYSLGMTLNDKKFGYSRSLQDIENSPYPSMLNEFVWFWLDSNAEPASLTPNVAKRWLGFSSTKEQRLEHQAFLASELVELFRRMQVDGIAPFVYLSIDGRATANWFLGDIEDLKPKPILAALKNAFAPFGLSLELWDRHFFKNENREINVYVFNDSGVLKKGTVECKIVDLNGKIVFQKNIPVSVDACNMQIYPVTFVFPKNAGEYKIVAELKSGEENVIALSRKVVYVFDAIQAPQSLKHNRIVVFDPDKEIDNFIKTLGLNTADFNNTVLKSGDILIIGEGGLISKEYSSRFNEIDKFVQDGNVLIVIEPSYGIEKHNKVILPGGHALGILSRESKLEGGYNSYVFKSPKAKNFPLWEGIEDDHLKMFNGGYGGVIISDYIVKNYGESLQNINLRLFKSVSNKAFTGLNLIMPVIYEMIAGEGIIVVSRIQVRGRLMPFAQKDSLYSRCVDPVAQQYLINLLKTYGKIDSVLNALNKDVEKLKMKDVYTSTTDPAFLGKHAFDKNKGTRWSSQFYDPQWIIVDLGDIKRIKKVKLYWEAAYGKEYYVYLSQDMCNWQEVYHEKNGNGGIDEIEFAPARAQYVAVYGVKRGTAWGYSLWEIEAQ